MLDDPKTTPPWRAWPVKELIDYIEAAADERTLISGAMLNRLAFLDPKGAGAPFPADTWYEVAPRGVAPAIGRIRERMKEAATHG